MGNSRQWLPSLTTAVIGGAVGALIAVVGSVLVVNTQIQAERTAEVREQRADVYFDFLTAANSYSNASQTMAMYLASTDTPVLVAGVEPYNAYLNARYDFRDTTNRLSVYGTKEAWAMGIVLIGTLPNTKQESDFTFNIESFNLTYQAMLDVACVELNPDDRPDCSLPG